MTKKVKKITIKENYLRLSKLSIKELEKEFNVDTSKGLTIEEAKSREEDYLKKHKLKTHKYDVIKIIISSFFNPFSLILIVIDIFTFLSDVIFSAPEERSYLECSTILGIIILSGIIHLFNELSSYFATNKLLKEVSSTSTVLRDSIKEETDISSLVKGDIIYYSQGDIISTDAIILNSKDLFIDESSLTGENIPKEKSEVYKNTNSLIEINNILFKGSSVVSGNAKVLTIATRSETYFSEITKSKRKKEKTAFDKGVNQISKLFIIMILIIVPLVIIINILTKKSILDSIAFALTISLGLTPELLPMIVASCLAKGRKKLAKEKLIIKDLSSINNLGSINILCSDKTGTITENASKLEKIISFNNDEEILFKYAYFNSYFQSGLKNQIDKAINEYETNDQVNLIGVTKLDEIPFDFSRRRLSILIKENNQNVLITKGSVEDMLKVSSSIYKDNKVINIDEEIKSKILKDNERYNKEGYRLLLVGIKNVTNETISLDDEQELTLLGFLAFYDPLKESSLETITKLKELGVELKILTGDNKNVSLTLAKRLNIKDPKVIDGEYIDSLSDEELLKIVQNVNIFAKLSPDNKERVIISLKKLGNKVGFIGDGINDALALKASDIGISVNNASDIAKESSKAIMLNQDLSILVDAIIEGRKTHFNMMKYIKITISSNFGNIISILFASIFLPFFPILPTHILLLNIIYDLSCLALINDNVDKALLTKPVSFSTKGIIPFMLIFGPISTIFDITTFLFNYFIFLPYLFNSSFNSLSDTSTFILAFQTLWFFESFISQLIVIISLRTGNNLLKSRPSIMMLISFVVSICVVFILIYSPLNKILLLETISPLYYLYIFVVIILYITLVIIAKKLYLKKSELY